MTTKKISELTELIALSDTDAVPLVHAGVTKRISAANLKASVLGGTVTATNFAATSNGLGTSFKVGDDAWLGDINIANSVSVRGIQDGTQGYIVFGNSNSTSYIGRSGTGPITVTGAFAATGNLTAQNINTTGNIIPLTDNVYTLGSSVNRWQSAYIGPGSIYMQDTANAALNAELTVTNGVLLVNGANQLQVGQLKFVNNTIESTSGATDIQIGLTGSTADLVLNRNTVIAAGKTFTAGNVSVGNLTVTGTFVPSKGITHNVKMPALVANVAVVDFANDDLVHLHTNNPGSTITANLVNLSSTVGKTVEVLIMSSSGGTTQFNHGVSSGQSTNGSSIFVTSRQTMYVKYFNLDGTTGNLFVTAIGNNIV